MKSKFFTVLAAGVILAVMTGAGIVYGSLPAEEVDAEAGDTLSFNDDTSIRNDSDRELWIRVEPVYDSRYDADDYTIVSDAIDKGMWESDGNNRYYYFEALDAGCTTEPLVDRLLYKGGEVSAGTTGSFSLHIEAVDEAWLEAEPGSGIEAFEMFRGVTTEPENIYL